MPDKVVAQAASLLYRRLPTCEGRSAVRQTIVFGHDTRRVTARVPTGSRRNSRQGCLRYAKIDEIQPPTRQIQFRPRLGAL